MNASERGSEGREELARVFLEDAIELNLEGGRESKGVELVVHVSCW